MPRPRSIELGGWPHVGSIGVDWCTFGTGQSRIDLNSFINLIKQIIDLLMTKNHSIIQSRDCT